MPQRRVISSSLITRIVVNPGPSGLISSAASMIISVLKMNLLITCKRLLLCFILWMKMTRIKSYLCNKAVDKLGSWHFDDNTLSNAWAGSTLTYSTVTSHHRGHIQAAWLFVCSHKLWRACVVLIRNDEKVASSKKRTQFKTRGQKPYTIYNQNGLNWYPIYDQNGSKTLPFRTAHTYTAYKKGIPRPPPPRFAGAKPTKLLIYTIRQ